MIRSDHDDTLRRWFSESGHTMRFEPSAHLLRQGERPTEVHLLTAGAVKVAVVASSGRESILEIRAAGALVGELSIITEIERTASVIAIAATETLVVPGGRFRDALRGPEFALALLHVTATRLAQASKHQHQVATGDSVGRVCSVLVDLARRADQPETGVSTISHSLSQQELANFAGVSRDAVVRVLQLLRTNDWIETGRQVIKVKDLSALEDLAAT